MRVGREPGNMMRLSSTGSRPGLLVVWDFDWSLVNENSDTWVVKQLGDELTPEFRRLRVEEGLGWTAIMQRQMHSLWGKGVSESEIRWSMTRLPVQPRMLDAVCLAGRARAQQAIVSDSNTVFIESFLGHHGLQPLFSKGVHTNRSEFQEDGRLDVQPYHRQEEPAHACRLCPPNMCKGKILDELLLDMREADRSTCKVIYVGDGNGDYCPALRLRQNDVVLARGGANSTRSFGLWQRIGAKEGGEMRCRVKLWETGDDVYAHFEEELQESLPRTS